MTVHQRDWQAFVVPADDGAVHMDLAVDGITCAACMGEIERGLKRLPGIRKARVNLTSQRLAVDWVEDQTGADEIVAELERLGYAAHPFDPASQKERQDKTGKQLLRCLAVSGFAGMNIMLLSVSVWSGNASDITPETRDFFHWLSALIALPTVAYSGQPFVKSAFRALSAGRLNMDVPIVIGVGLAVALSVVQTIQHHHHAYFESAVMLLFFLLVGRYLDHNMRGRTRSFAENIAALKAEVAARINPDGSVREVPLSKIAAGDLVLVAGGERVPVDGVVSSGISEIDQSLVTGESVLVPVKPGQRVYAGTLNGAGALQIRVEAASGATLLDEVNRLLETASQAKSKYVRIADRAAQLYAPLVHGAAGLTFLGWLLAGMEWQPALVIAISVLIITCPCALGLAVPAVQVVASGQLFKSGVLLNSADAIERMADIDTILFDKTGTLTLAEPELVGEIDRQDPVLGLAGQLALASRHPLSMALVKATGALVPLADVQEVSGAGLETHVDGQRLRLGSPLFCGATTEAIEERLLAVPGASLLAVQYGQEPVRLLAVRQKLRSDAREVVDRLKAQGYALEIVSGDTQPSVAECAEALGIENWQAAMTPSAKIACLEALQSDGRKVLMVGDGLNDAPALAGAHVSLSPVSAVYLSQAAADAVFLGKKLQPVFDALWLSIRARRAIEQNLWISTVYNIIAVPIAVAGFVTPLMAAVAMSASSLAVTANALRLKWGNRVTTDADATTAFGSAASPKGE
ncbi:heavy metal translocating P-type ATPase [Roseibium alexandrii]|uniref:Copper-(Or silver)-translocating P-type ATPase n=1 Tax=Roseibium alexandrii (strain DSM 17067 / NCIMB 14079 / DFL-11) TaxID=244592 RepID=A0A5E8H0W5_ROSAD|nr:heavy metal translocating P-type ATPase [Roseibium alexandrii]EEE45649.1 copper-(or silver)-translocating P-type ATPase [Roseibium alexandrii DFL-11]